MHPEPDPAAINDLLERALQTAVRAHLGQKDRYGTPYIFHPIRVMQRLIHPTDQVVALLHDVVEDSPVTLEELLSLGFPQVVVDAVDALTRRLQEPYTDAIRRAAATPMATRVKLADLEDHLDLRRASPLTEADLARLNRYLDARDFLHHLAPDLEGSRGGR